MVVTALILASVLLSESPAAPKKAYPDLFESRECRFADEQGEPQVAGYQLFVPRVIEPDERYPLLVFPVFGDWLNSLLLTDPEHPEKYRFFVLVLGSADNFAEILQDIVRMYPVDQDRIYLSGPSQGGYVCVWIAKRHPELIAAAAPLAAGGTTEDVAKLVRVPMWVFVNRGDPPHFANAEQLVAAVKDAGGNAHLTAIPANGHDSWTAAFKNYDVMAWLLEQRRGGPYWRLPGQEPWQWWHIVTLPCILLVFVRLAWSVEQWRRRRETRRVAVLLESDAEADFCLGEGLRECESIQSIVEDGKNPNDTRG